MLDFVYSCRNQADKDKVISPSVHKLVFFIAGNEYHGTAGYLPPITVLEDFANAGMDENFMFPFMGVSWGESAGGKGKDPHAEIFCLIFFADGNSAGNAFGYVVVKRMGW